MWCGLKNKPFKVIRYFPKSFFLLCIWVYDVQAFNVLTNRLPTAKTTHSDKWVNQSFHITLESRAGSGIWVCFCVLYAQLCEMTEGLIQRILITLANPFSVSSFSQMPHKMNRWATSFWSIMAALEYEMDSRWESCILHALFLPRSLTLISFINSGSV